MNDSNKRSVAKFIISLIKTISVGFIINVVIIIVYAYNIYPPKTTYCYPEYETPFIASIIGREWPKSIDDKALLWNEVGYVDDYYSAYYNPKHDTDNKSCAFYASSYNQLEKVKVSDVLDKINAERRDYFLNELLSFSIKTILYTLIILTSGFILYKTIKKSVLWLKKYGN